MKDIIAKVSRFRHPRHIAWRRVAEEVVVLDLETSLYFSLNDSGAFIWERLGAGDSVRDIEKALREAYDSVPAKAKGEIESFINALLDERLLEPVAA